jgi:hypothetical protein
MKRYGYQCAPIDEHPHMRIVATIKYMIYMRAHKHCLIIHDVDNRISRLHLDHQSHPTEHQK